MPPVKTTLTKPESAPIFITYSAQIEAEIKTLSAVIEAEPELTGYHSRWLSVQLLEGDEKLTAEVIAASNGHLSTALETSLSRLQHQYGEDVDVVLADYRYKFANNLVQNVITRPEQLTFTTSDKIDRIVTNRWLGIPIFLAMMWVVFKVTTDVATPYLDWVDWFFSTPLANWVTALLTAIGLGGSWIESLFVDGIIAGVGGVLVFVPVLMSLYFALAILEDTGYMARGAFVMDRLMNKLGLHGKSFLPMIVGFGCTVPALYATRTLENEKDRILTGLLLPFMSCGARLPVYILFSAIFFPNQTGIVIFGLYMLGILVAVTLGIFLKNTVFKEKEQSAFVMELPPYRLPNLRNIWLYVWKRTSSFIRNAWTIILAASIIVWLLMAIPFGGTGSFANTDMNNSAFSKLADTVSPMFKPNGFDSWEASGALFTGIIAKEVVISTMAQVYNVETEAEEREPTTLTEDLTEIGLSFFSATVDTIKSIPAIIGINFLEEDAAEEDSTALFSAVRKNFAETSGGHGAPAALAFLVFILIYTPCMATIAVERQELGTKWTLVSVVGQFVLAWVLSALVFQGALLLGLG